MKREMTAREYLRAMKRVRDECLHSYTPCKDCRLFHVCTCDGTKAEIEHAVSTLEEWLAAHPEPKPTIFVPDEIVRVTTIEMTQIVPKELIGNHEIMQDKIEKFKNGLHEFFRFVYYPDDLHIKVQQLVTKGHEEEA